MLRPARTTFVLLALVGIATVGGCGGSDDESGETTASTTNGQAQNERLSSTSWDTYMEAARQARAVNTASTATFRKCRSIPDLDSQAVEDCLGTATSDVVTEGQKLLATLNGFDDEIGGACATANTNLAGSVKLYIASVNAIGVAVDSGSVATTQSAIDNALEGLNVARDARPPFEAACRPV